MKFIDSNLGQVKNKKFEKKIILSFLFIHYLGSRIYIYFF